MKKNIWKYVLGVIMFVMLVASVKADCSVAASYAKLDGTYKINTKVKENMMLDVAAGSSQNGANIQIYTNNGSNAQQFKVTHISSGWHKICNVSSGKALDVKNGTSKSGVNVQLYTYNGTKAQLWRFYSAGDGYYYIQNKLGYYLDVAGGKSANSTNVCVYEKNSTNAQRWKPIKIVYPQKVSMTPASVSLKSIGAVKKLTAVITPTNTTEKIITWTTSNSNIATVSNGTVKAVGSGTATITAKTSNGKTASTQVEVQDGCVNIQSGLYNFNTQLSSDFMLDVTGNKTSDGTNIQIYKNNGSMAQKFYIQSVGYGWYEIYNAFPKKSVDVQGGTEKSGTNVQLYKNNGTNAQRWRFYSAGNGYYYVMSGLGCYLDVYAGDAKNGTNVIVWSKNGTNAQRWRLIKTTSEYVNVAEGLYKLNTKVHSNLMLDVAGNETADGTNIQIYSNNNSIAQKFYIQNAGGGWYKITNPFSGKCLDVKNGSKASDTNVQLYTHNNSDAQKWRFIMTGDGQYFTIKNKLGCCLDVYGGADKNATNVLVWSANGTNAQKWGLIPTSMIELTGIRLNSGAFTLDGAGKTKNLSVTYIPSNATAANTRVTWSTSNAGVATVSNGVVQAVGAGSATITARSYNGKTASAVVTVKPAGVMVTLSVPSYKQYDSRWSNTYIGNKTIGSIGCLLTSISMKYSYQTGTTTYPNAMKSKLRFSNNDLIWSSVSNLGYAHTSYSCSINNAIMNTIYNNLKANKPVIIGGQNSRGMHWVVITGYKGSNTVSFNSGAFSIDDPNSSTRTTLSQFLSAYPTVVGLVY